MAESITLTEPIRHGDREITALELKAPTFKQVRQYGMPFDDKGMPRYDLVFKYAQDILQLPPSVLDQLVAEDVQKLTLKLIAFFVASDRQPKPRGM